MKYRICPHTRTAAEWTALNFVLLLHEIGYESDTRYSKLGDGVTGWNALPYIASAKAGSLVTPRNINGVPFDGSADITINAVDSTARIAVSEKGVANGVASLDSGGKVPTGQLPAVTTISGNAATATALQNARTFAISGGATGTATSFDGSANIAIPVTGLDMASANAGTLATGRGGTGVTSSTGSGSNVLSSAGTLTTPRFTGAEAFRITGLYSTFYSSGGTWLSYNMHDGTDYLWINLIAGGRMIWNAAAGHLWQVNNVDSLKLDGSSLRGAADNVLSVGTASFRFTTIYATTGTINTSDARRKRWIAALGEHEYRERYLRAAMRIAQEIGIYQWLEEIARKGEDSARIHVGIRAQQAVRIMIEEGLEEATPEGERPSFRHAFLCYDSWGEETEAVYAQTERQAVAAEYEQVGKQRDGTPILIEVQTPLFQIEHVPFRKDREGRKRLVPRSVPQMEMVKEPTGEIRVTRKAGDAFGIRPDQLALFVAGAQEIRIAALEALLALT